MTRLLMMKAKDLERFLLQLRFAKTRQTGSHAFYRHVDGRTTVIPLHVGRDLSRPLLRSILRDIKLDVDRFNELLAKL